MIGSRVEDGIAILSIDRAEKANALPEAGKRALAEELTRMVDDQEVDAVVLTGQGDRFFCAGSDIAEMHGFNPSDMYRMLGAEREMYLAVLSSPKPVVAAVNGFALGAGLILVMACDYAVAAATARFGMPELTIGVAAPLEGFLLPWVVGLGYARRLFYTGHQLDATEAMAGGLVQEVTEPRKVLGRAVEIAREIGALPGAGFTVQKALLHRLVSTGDLDSVIDASRYATSLQFADEATTEAMSSFLGRKRRTDNGGHEELPRTETMKGAEFLDDQLGPAAALITAADRDWLARESRLVERVSLRLAEVEKTLLDFAPNHRITAEER